MLKRSKFLSGRKIHMSSFSKKTERDPRKLCNNASTVKQWVMKETWFCLQQTLQKAFVETLSLLNFEYFLCWAFYLYSWTAISSAANIMIQTTWGTWGLVVSSAMDEPIPLLMTITRHSKATGWATLRDTMKSTPPSRERHSSINPLQPWSSANVKTAWMATPPLGTAEGRSDPTDEEGVLQLQHDQCRLSHSSVQTRRGSQGRQQNRRVICVFTPLLHTERPTLIHPEADELQMGGGHSTYRATWGTKRFLQTSRKMLPCEHI